MRGKGGDMVAELEYKPSCNLPFVTTGIQMNTAFHNRANTNFYLYTTVETVKIGYCLHCGNPFFKNIADIKKNIKFCCRGCATKFYKQKLKEENLRLAYNHVNQSEFQEFYKKYTNYVYAKIYEQDHKYTEDLHDWWNEQAIRLFYCIKKWEKKHGRECNKYAFFQKAVIYATQNIISKRKHEVFYDECSLKTQQMILGDYHSMYD